MLSRKMILFDEKPIKIDELTDFTQYIQCETGTTPATCSENAECVVESLNQKGVCICHYGFYGDGVDCRKTQKVGVDIALMSLGIQQVEKRASIHKKISQSGNRTRVSRVTGADTHHYTN